MYKSMWKNRFENCTIIGRFGGPVPSGLIKRPLRKEWLSSVMLSERANQPQVGALVLDLIK